MNYPIRSARILLTVLCLSICFIQPHSLGAGEKMSILVYPFQNTGNNQFSWISAGMTDTVVSDLGRLKDINVITDSDRRKAVKEMEFAMSGLVSDDSIARVGDICGANMIFTGSYTVAGNRIRVVGRLFSVESSKTQKSVKIDGDMDKIFDLQDRIVIGLMSESAGLDAAGVDKVTLKDEDIKTIRKGYTPGAEAFKYYSMGLESLEKNPSAAINYLNKAVNLEPKYFSALSLAGWAYSLAGDLDKALEYLNRARALVSGQGLSGTSDEAYLYSNIGIIQWYRADSAAALDNYNKSLSIWDKLGMRNSYAAATTALIGMGSAYRMIGDMDRSLATYSEAQGILERTGFTRSTGYAWLMANTGALYMNKADYPAAIAPYNKAIEVWKSLGLVTTMGPAYAECELGYVYGMKGEGKWGVELLHSGLKKCEKLGLVNSTNYAYYNFYLGAVYDEKLNNPCAGAPFMAKAADLFEKQKSSIAPGIRERAISMKARCGK